MEKAFSARVTNTAVFPYYVPSAYQYPRSGDGLIALYNTSYWAGLTLESANGQKAWLHAGCGQMWDGYRRSLQAIL